MMTPELRPIRNTLIDTNNKIMTNTAIFLKMDKSLASYQLRMLTIIKFTIANF